MASKAQKAQVIITANASVAKRVMEELQKSAEAAKMRMIELAAAGEQNSKAYKKAEAEFQAFNSAMRENVKDSVRVDQVMKQLSKTANVDLKRALAAATRELNKMSEGSPRRQKLIDDINRLKAQINGNNGLTMSFKQAQTQLKNLDNVSMDKLKQGLAAIKSQLDNPNIGNKWRRSLEQMQQQYQAAMAVRTAPVGTMPVTRMNAQQLGAERTALMSAIAATSGVKGYEGKVSGFEQRLKSVNEQLKVVTDNEKKADQAAKQLQATQEAAGTVRAVYRGQAVELEKLQAAYKTLQARQQQFAGTNDAKARAAAQQMALLKNRIDKVTAAMQAEIKIDKQFLKTATNQQLQNALTQLQQKLQSLNSTQSATAQKLKADMKAVETQIKRNTGAIQQQGSTFGTAIKNIAAYVGVFGAFNMIKSKVMEVYKSNLKLSDSLADIRKVSGLTSQEIDKLYTNITRIDTRNTIETLNKLAYAGAKLGVQEHGGVEALTGFVRSAEMVQMSLGEDLGEDALPALAKLTEVMGLMDKYGVEQSMQKAASAIFQLSTTSTATGKNIVEFSKRLMGLANVSRVTADELLAIGSAADAMGLMPEVAATAFNKLFTSIQKGHNMIEKSLGLVQGSINENFAKGQTIKSIVDIFESMNKKGNMNALDGIFKDLGSDGARLVAVMTTMADRVDILKKHLETSTKSFKDGTAVINEYMIQNETANALMERAQNMWAKAFTNPEGVDMVKQMAQEWYEVSKALTQSEGSMAAFHSGIEGITTTVITLIKTLPFLIKMLTWFGIFGGIRMMVNSFVALAASIRAATTATATLQAVMNSNWVLAGIAAVVGGISLYIDHMNAAAEAAERAQKRQAELDMQLAKSKEAIATVAVPLESYKRALNESNYSLERRNQLMKDLLKGEYQDYLDYLGIEIDGAIDLAKAYDMVVKVLKQKKAYEEREQYRDEVNQNNKVDRMRAGMQFGQTAKSLGAGAEVDAEWLRRRHNLPVEDVMASVVKSAGGSVKSMDFGRGVSGYSYYDKAGNLIEAKVLDRLRKNIREYSASRNTENRLNKEVDDLYKEEVGDFDMEKFQDSLFKARLKRKGQLDNLKPDKEALKQQKKEEAERRKALRAEMKEEQAQAKAIIDNVRNYYQRQINAITELANTTGMDPKLQEQMVNGMKERMNEALANVRKAIGGTKNDWEAFKQTMRDDLYEPLGEDGTNLSTELLDKVMDNNLGQLRAMIERLSKELNQQGSVLLDQILRKASENEGINAKIENALMRAREKELLERNYTGKVDKDTEGTMEQFGIAAITDAQSKQIRDWSAQGNDAAIERFLEMRTKYWQVAFGNARKNLLGLLQQDVNTKQGQESVLQLLFGEDWKEGLTGSELEGILNMTADQWQVFYMKLIEYTDRWTDAQKKAYDENKKRQDYIFENRTDVIGLNSLEIGYEQQSKANQRWGKPQTFAERMGLGSMNELTNDPEVKMMEIRLTKAELYYKKMEELRRSDQISEEQLMDAKKQWSTAQEALMDKLAEQAKQKMEQIQQLLDPIKEFGAAAGEAMYLTVNGLDGEGEAWRNAVKNIIKTYGEMTIQMIEKQLLQMIVMKQHHQEQEDEEQAHQDRMKQIQNQGNANEISAQNVLNAKILSTKRKANKTEEKEDKKSETEKVSIAGEGGTQLLDIATQVGTGMVTAKKQEADQTQQIEQQQQATSLSGLITDTVAKVVLGIAGGSAKTISELGWWGLPLVAVISAALMGLLNYALSAIGGGKGGSEKAAAKPKVKLASGMLTYDKGNVQETVGSWRGKNGEYLTDERRTVVGDDGRVYRAREQRSLPQGVSMVTEPIATRVNGQQALVGERGPEIVIGRKTTRAIQMNRPDLLRDLALIDRGITTRKVRAFDEGNLSELASAMRPDGEALPTQQQTANGQIDAATADALRQLPVAMAAFAQVMGVIQKDGIPANLNMFGENGAYKKFQQADKFYKKYGG